MIAPQYKNIIQWTLCSMENNEQSDSLTSARLVFNNLGVAFPHGDLKSIIEVLDTNVYLGWRACEKENVQKYADMGIASVGVSESSVIVILPNQSVPNLAFDKTISEHDGRFTCCCCDIPDEIQNTMKFYVYSYGYIIN